MFLLNQCRAVIGAATLSMLLSGCTTTTTDDYNLCALGFGLAGLGIGVASSGTGVVIAGAAGGAGAGYLLCEEEPSVAVEPVVIPPSAPRVQAPIPAGDEDGDGINDDRDECPGTPAAVEVDYKGCAKPLVFDSAVLTFDFDSARLVGDASTILSPAVAFVGKYPGTIFEVVGHTDAKGGARYNQNLSLQRAQAVKARLMELGVPEATLKVRGRGEAEPLSTNETDAGRARNRRVEIRPLN